VKQVLLATALVLGATGAFFGGRAILIPASATVQGPSLGDLSAMAAIVTDVQGIAKTGDIPAAKARITDLETAWDEAQPTLQPKNPESWGRVDAAIDDSLSALRAGRPDPAEVGTTLTALQTALADPSQGGAAAGGVVMIGSVAVTDASGHPLPCEAMLKTVVAQQATATLAPEAAAKVDDLVAKATERCNADDDKTSDSFSAQALQAMAKN
jgi:hypothetical protein